MNLLGVESKDVAIRIHEDRHEVAVYTRQEGYSNRRGRFWVFGVPADAEFALTQIDQRGGAIEIKIPKASFACAA
jgi:hypothetical protein